MPHPMTAERAADETPRDAAMSELLTGMQGRLRAFVRKLAREDVDDIAQETMARAWRSRHTFDSKRSTGESWLLRIAFRAFLDLRQAKGNTLPATGHGIGTSAGEVIAAGGDPVHQAAVREHTAALLGSLSAIERDVLLRFHRDGESIEQIARTLKTPAGTIKSHLHRARNRLWASERSTGGTT
jgi:RNA polymerase sigma-70 factor (ECF subfamily)